MRAVCTEECIAWKPRYLQQFIHRLRFQSDGPWITIYSWCKRFCSTLHSVRSVLAHDVCRRSAWSCLTAQAPASFTGHCHNECWLNCFSGRWSGGQTCWKKWGHVFELHSSKHWYEVSCCLSVVGTSAGQLLATFLHCHKSVVVVFLPLIPNGNQSVTEHLSRSYSKIAPSVIA